MSRCDFMVSICDGISLTSSGMIAAIRSRSGTSSWVFSVSRFVPSISSNSERIDQHTGML